MYTRKRFGEDLKLQIKQKKSLKYIAARAFSVYSKYDTDFDEILLILNTLDLGPEFEFSYEELEQIADDLITGKNVKTIIDEIYCKNSKSQ